MKRKWKQSR